MTKKKLFILINGSLDIAIAIICFVLFCVDKDKYGNVATILGFIALGYGGLAAIFASTYFEKEEVELDKEDNDDSKEEKSRLWLSLIFATPVFICTFLSYLDILLSFAVSSFFLLILGIVFIGFKKKLSLDKKRPYSLFISIIFVILLVHYFALAKQYGQIHSANITLGENSVTFSYYEIYSIFIVIISAISLIPFITYSRKYVAFIYSLVSMSFMDLIVMIYTLMIGASSGILGVTFTNTVSQANGLYFLIGMSVLYYLINLLIMKLAFDSKK